MRWLISFLVLLAVIVFGKVDSHAEDAVVNAQAVADGKKVTFDYTLSVDGKVVETSKEEGPMEYTQGDDSLIPGLAKQMEGLKVGDEKIIVVPADKGFGPVDPQAVQEVPRSAIGADIELSVGLLLQMNDPEGNAYPATVKEIKDDKVVIDFNHPLAGKELTFNVKITDIK